MAGSGFSNLNMWQFILISFVAAQTYSLSDSEECGLIDSRVSGDVRTKVPWTASIFRKSQTNCGKWIFWKSAYIIGPSTVLMSGRHFWSDTTSDRKDLKNTRVLPIRSSDFLVGVGMISDDLGEGDFYTHFYHVKNIIPHYQSYKRFSPFDVAVIHLEETIGFNAYAKPICIKTGWEAEAPLRNFSTTVSDVFIKAGFESEKGFVYVYKNPVVLGSYPYDADCSVELQQANLTTPNSNKDESNSELPVKRCVDLDSGLAVKRDGNRWYLASVMTGGLLADPEIEAWTYFSPLEKTYSWIKQNLICGANNFTCYEGKCIPLPQETTSEKLLSECEENDSKYYNGIVESQEKCSTTNGIFKDWCNNCADIVQTGMLDKGDEYSSILVNNTKPKDSNPNEEPMGQTSVNSNTSSTDTEVKAPSSKPTGSPDENSAAVPAGPLPNANTINSAPVPQTNINSDSQVPVAPVNTNTGNLVYTVPTAQYPNTYNSAGSYTGQQQGNGVSQTPVYIAAAPAGQTNTNTGSQGVSYAVPVGQTYYYYSTPGTQGYYTYAVPAAGLQQYANTGTQGVYYTYTAPVVNTGNQGVYYTAPAVTNTGTGSHVVNSAPTSSS